MTAKATRSERLMRAYLLLVATPLVPIALSYGIAPATVLPKLLDISVEGVDQMQIFRALMCLYSRLGFWVIAAFTPAWQRVAVIWAVLFCFSLAIGRTISLAVDGPASRLSIFISAWRFSAVFSGSQCWSMGEKQPLARR